MSKKKLYVKISDRARRLLDAEVRNSGKNQVELMREILESALGKELQYDHEFIGTNQIEPRIAGDLYDRVEAISGSKKHGYVECAILCFFGGKLASLNQPSPDLPVRTAAPLSETVTVEKVVEVTDPSLLAEIERLKRELEVAKGTIAQLQFTKREADYAMDQFKRLQAEADQQRSRADGLYSDLQVYKKYDVVIRWFNAQSPMQRSTILNHDQVTAAANQIRDRMFAQMEADRRAAGANSSRHVPLPQFQAQAPVQPVNPLIVQAPPGTFDVVM